MADVKEEKKVKVLIGTYTDACYGAAQEKVKNLKEKGFGKAALQPGKKHLHIIAGEFSEEDAKKEIDKLKAAGFHGATFLSD